MPECVGGKNEVNLPIFTSCLIKNEGSVAITSVSVWQCCACDENKGSGVGMF